ncbi:hypothetical protein MRX96_001268 [Rhipicephalus microplus]
MEWRCRRSRLDEQCLRLEGGSVIQSRQGMHQPRRWPSGTREGLPSRNRGHRQTAQCHQRKSLDVVHTPCCVGEVGQLGKSQIEQKRAQYTGLKYARADGGENR